MTALDLQRAGFFIRLDRQGFVLLGPEDRADLVEALRGEVSRRVDVMASPPRLTVRDACDACGDAMAVGRGGWCMLCTMARQKAVQGRATNGEQRTAA